MLDPVVAAETVGRAEGLVALAARVFLHLLRQEKRGRASPKSKTEPLDELKTLLQRLSTPTVQRHSNKD